LTRRSIDLQIATSKDWVHVVLGDFDAFLLDHANCERKASALAMSLVVKYPDRTEVIPGLIDLAQEELQHFREVYDVLSGRGLTLQKDAPDPYINRLLKLARHGRDERFIDRMLISSVVECRGAERFGILAEALTDEKMRGFYDRLCKSETKHGHQFARMLLSEYPENIVYPRLEELMTVEAQIIKEMKLRPALH
jgi:tRNA-(ms[2]io[6]A)-hydroxylase